MRIPFLLAASDGMAMQIINNIDAMEYLPPASNGDRCYPAITVTIAGSDYLFLIHKIANGISLPWPSAAVSEKWDMFLALPADSVSYERSIRLYNKMRNFILSSQNRNGQGDWYLQGPWSLKKIQNTYPSFSAQYLEIIDEFEQPTGVLNVPIMFGGDPLPTVVAQVDYSPTDEDCASDIVPEESTLY